MRAKSKPRIAAPGDRLKFVAKVKNSSAFRSQATTVDFYLSADGDLGADARWLGEARLAALSTGRRKSARLKTLLPDDLEPGRYALIAVADNRKENYDLHRANNLVVAKKKIRVVE